MTRTVSAPHLRPMPRFTFAGRGCRDTRREPRRLPAPLLPRATTVMAAGPVATVAAPVAKALSRAAAQRPAGTGAARPAADRPPPPGR